MLRRFLKNQKGASEIVGTALFLVILFFFFSNVFLWQDQVTREMDQVIADKMNSAIRVEAFSNATTVWLKTDNIGGLDVTLSRLWIITDDAHYYADFEPYNLHIEAGRHMNITFTSTTITNTMRLVRVSVVAGSVFVDYNQTYQTTGTTVTYRIITNLANSAACSLTR
jgi:hypothetical protein